MKKHSVRCPLYIAIIAILFILPLSYTRLAVNNAYAIGATLSLSPSTGTFNKGCNFTLNINLDTGGAQTDGSDVILFYDPTRFTANAIHNGTIFSDYPGNNIDAANGKITLAGLSSLSSAFSGAGVMSSIDFTVVGTAPAGTSQIKFDFDPNDKAKSTDSNVADKATATDMLNQVVDGNYTIGSGTCGTSGGSSSGGGTIDSTDSGLVKKPIGGPLVTKTPVLPVSGNTQTTVIIAMAGSILTILGLLGLALL